VEDGGDVLIFPHSHQDPSRIVLNVLPLNAFAGDTNEKCVAVVQSAGDKGLDEFLRV